MHVFRLATALLSALAFAPMLLALPLADASPSEALLPSTRDLVENIPAAPAPKTHMYTRRARAHP